MRTEDVCACGSGKRPLGVCTVCGKKYCADCRFVHEYTPPPMNTADFLYSILKKKQ